MEKVIYANVWRNMSASEIADSIDFAIRVLKEKPIKDQDTIAKLLLIASDITEMLALRIGGYES
jgi:chromosome condensin MukBEF complex kleisin-like MukF subunit